METSSENTLKKIYNKYPRKRTVLQIKKLF